jgi:cytochrome c oxidase subunit 4
MSQQTTSADAHSGHPTPATYFKVAMILSAITAAEVGIFYVTWLSYGIIPILAIMSIAKFVIVGMFYMHLKYDNRLFSGLFVTGLLLATAVIFALLGLFRFFA